MTLNLGKVLYRLIADKKTLKNQLLYRFAEN